MWSFKTDEVENFAYVDGVFSKLDCEKIVKTLEPLEKEIAKTGASKTAKTDKKVRDSSVSWVRPDNNEELFRKLSGVCMAANEKFLTSIYPDLVNLYNTRDMRLPEANISPTLTNLLWGRLENFLFL